MPSDCLTASTPITQSMGYRNHAALLISWTEDCDDLKTEDEVDALARVFKHEYGFTAETKKLGHHRRPQAQLNKFIVDFMEQYDDGDSLLIIYYAGHGYSGGTDGLRLAGSMRPQKPEPLNSVIWKDCEALLTQASADILEIFDCCYAGDIQRSPSHVVPPQSCPFPPPFSERRFETIAACAANEWTNAPGRSSFTSALIWALKELTSADRFDTLGLLNTIANAPDFPINQHPSLFQRCQCKESRITLVRSPPLQSQSGEASTPLLENNLGLPPLQPQSGEASTHPLENKLLKRVLENLQNHVNNLYASAESLSREFKWLQEGRDHVIAYRSYTPLPPSEPALRQRRTPHPLVAVPEATESAYVNHELQLLPTSNNPIVSETTEPPPGVQMATSWLSKVLKWLQQCLITGSVREFWMDRSTVLFATFSGLVISASFTARASFEQREPACSPTPSIDDNFYSNLSQLTISLCSIYLTTVPLLRSQSLRRGYKFWYRLCFTSSFASAVTSAAVYPYSWRASLILGTAAGISQVIGTVQLIECFQDVKKMCEVV